MLKQPIYVEFNLDDKVSSSKLIAISHVDDRYSEIIEVALKQNGRHIYAGGTTVIARMVLHRDKDYLLSDNVACSVNDNGNILIPFDNAVVKTSQGVVKIEVNITRDTDELTLQFPLWVSVTGSILDNAEVTPESKGTIPDLLKDAADALEDAKEALEEIGDSKIESGVVNQNGTITFFDENGDPLFTTTGESVIGPKGDNGDTGAAGADGYSPTVSTTNLDAQTLVTVTDNNGAHNFYVKDGSSVTNAAVDENGDLIISIQQKPTSSVHPTIYTLEVNAGHVVGAAGAKGDKGDKGDTGNDYVLTPQDKTDIAGMVDISGKADKATTLAGYGITDAYTKTQTDTFFLDTNADIADLKAYIGYTDGDILGLHADFENKVFTRLGAAVGLTAGQDFNAFPMYGQRRRVVVDSNGVIDETESPENITENDTNVDVMVYQPKFYYKVVPLKLEKQSGGLGYHIRKANYYISSTPHAGFKLHPLFYDANGNEVDYVLFSAYEASYMWRRQVNATDYINEIFHDGVDTDTTIDTTAVLKSLPGVKPISGQYKAMNKVNMENCALRKSSNWHLDTIKSVSANQLLVAIEYGTFNTQSAIGLGIVNNSNSNSNNCSSLTGSTSAETFNTASGMASETIYDDAGTETPFNTNGKVSVSYRGMENPWGNIWKHVNGINIWGDGTMNGGQVYIADNFNFNESSRSENYKSAGFTIASTSGYISAFGYGDEDYDWLFIPSETAGNSSIPVGDREFCTSNLSAYKIARYGGNWALGNPAGAFCLDCNSGTGFNYLYIGGRLLYVPTATGFEPQGPAGSNYVLTDADRQAIAQITMDGLNGNGVAY